MFLKLTAYLCYDASSLLVIHTCHFSLLPPLFEGDLISKCKLGFSFKEFKGASRTASGIDAIERVLAEDA